MSNYSTTKGVDVSAWQGEIDFKKVKDDNIDFVIIREGYGKKGRLPG